MAPRPPIKTYIVADLDIMRSPDDPLWTTPGMFDPVTMRPGFRVHEVAKCFFSMSAGWLRKHLRPVETKHGGVQHHYVSLDFGRIEPARTSSDNQVFSLYDIERLAYSFHEHGVITSARLACVIRIVRSHAEMWRLDRAEARREEDVAADDDIE